MPVFWFMFKVIMLLFGTVWLRASLPRLRYDQLMGLGWKFLIEIAFLWVMISGVVVVAKQEGWSMWIVLPSRDRRRDRGRRRRSTPPCPSAPRYIEEISARWGG